MNQRGRTQPARRVMVKNAALALSWGTSGARTIQLTYEALCRRHRAFTKFHVGRWWALNTARDIVAEAVLELGRLSQ